MNDDSAEIISKCSTILLNPAGVHERPFALLRGQKKPPVETGRFD